MLQRAAADCQRKTDGAEHDHRQHYSELTEQILYDYSTSTVAGARQMVMKKVTDGNTVGTVASASQMVMNKVTDEVADKTAVNTVIQCCGRYATEQVQPVHPHPTQDETEGLLGQRPWCKEPEIGRQRYGSADGPIASTSLPPSLSLAAGKRRKRRGGAPPGPLAG